MQWVVVRLAVLVALLLCVAQALVAWLSAGTFEKSLFPEIGKKVEVAGELAAEEIGYALSLDIPIDRLVGMDEFLDGMLIRHPDFAYVTMVGTDGETLYMRGLLADEIDLGDDRMLDLGTPIEVDGQAVASLHIGVREGSIRSELAELRNDILTIFIASLLVGVEILMAFVIVRFATPVRFAHLMLARGARGDFTNRIRMGGGEGGEFADAYNANLRRLNRRYEKLIEDAEDARSLHFERGEQQNISSLLETVRQKFHFATVEAEASQTLRPRSPMDIRIPFFLFILSQELSRPFLPVYFGQIYEPFLGIGRDVMIGLPITAFMLVVLIVTPFAGVLTDRIPPRSVFVVGVIPSVIGHVGTALAGSIVEALPWWMLSGAGYGIIFISAQAYVGRHVSASKRVTGMAVFAGAVYAAFVCGPAIGGILVDRLGPVQTLLAAAALAAISAVTALATVEPGAGQARVRQKLEWRIWGKLFHYRRFVAITVFSALPAKFALAGLFFYLVPLYLHQLGSGQSDVGRVMMAYGVACVILVPLIARRADHIGRNDVFLMCGGVIAGLGCLMPLLGDSIPIVLGTIAVMGIGHACLAAPQLAAIDDVANRISDEIGIGSGAVISAFRTIERVGTAAGAVTVGGLVTLIGYGEAMVVTGIFTLTCTGIYIFLVRGPRGVEVVAAA